MENTLLHENERLDELNRNGYKIIQHPKRFCFGIDAVLLGAFSMVREGEKVLDIGTGTGVIPILMEARYGGTDYTGIEIQSEVADMAKRSVEYNNLSDKIRIDNADVKDAVDLYGTSNFDVITTNPPYMTVSRGIVNPNDTKAISRHEVSVTIEDIARISSKLLREKGRFYMVHRPNRLMEIIVVLGKYDLEVKRLRMVHPYIDKDANMMLIEASYKGGAFMKVEKPLIVYNADGQYTNEVKKLYYD
ncbi:MAG: tRNA1(Val) (adenine(37)-N6)-methyltransferase [Lachnospiraceae bacterium]|nr:tRNA1(Val) (adenine(37)-N6)-methyltransferase [Lachnospiraceae bacterium]